MGAAIIAAAASIFGGVLVYYLTYRNNRSLSLRRDRVDRIDRQLSLLYGPLFAFAAASDIAWRKFLAKYNLREPYFGHARPSEDHLRRWETWMRNVFMPMNRKMYEAVVLHADLLIDDEIPDCLLGLFAHVSGYEVIFSQWERGDYSEFASLIDYPYREILEYAHSSYDHLKKEQAALLADIEPPSKTEISWLSRGASNP